MISETPCPKRDDADFPRVLLAIPVYNEEQYIDDVLDAVQPYIDDVLVIDDGSTDRSRYLLAERTGITVICHPRNQGYGKTIIDAFSYAACSGYDWVITMDCDRQHEPALIPDFVEAIKADDADIISGSRYLAKSERNGSPPRDRREINRTFTQLINEKLGLQLTDSFCGFKAHRTSAMKQLDLTERGYAVPLEFWVQAAAAKLRVKEIPVHLIYNDPNRSFGGPLDDPTTRLTHYHKVFEQTLEKVGLS